MPDFQTIEQAICRLQGDGYRLEACSDGVTRYVRHDAMNAIEACSGTEQAVFFLEKPGHHCTLVCGVGPGRGLHRRLLSRLPG
jgi:hypothetical protein